MSRKSIFPKPGEKPTRLSALARMGDGAGLHEAGGDTMLATPIGASVQDGPRMTTTHFGGKKAAPFVKGGGRSKTHPNDAKGRKRALAKAALKSKSADLSVVDLAMTTMRMAESHFNPNEPRDRMGKWVKRIGAAKTAHEIHSARADLVGDRRAGDISPAVYDKLDDVLASKIKALDETKKGTAKSMIHHGLTKESLRDKVKARLGERASAKEREYGAKNGGLGAKSPEEAAYLDSKNKVAKARLAKNPDAEQAALRDLAKTFAAFQAKHPTQAKKLAAGKKVGDRYTSEVTSAEKNLADAEARVQAYSKLPKGQYKESEAARLERKVQRARTALSHAKDIRAAVGRGWKV
jgi:hypothetical protein